MIYRQKCTFTILLSTFTVLKKKYYLHKESRHVEKLTKKNPFLRPGTTCYRGHRYARRIGTKS